MARVLIVEDDRAIREMIACALACEGHEVTTLSDGGRVVEVLSALHESCVVLLDLMMPWVDGWAVCRALEATPGLLARHPVIVMTATPLPESAYPGSASAVLHKPFGLEHLYRLIAALGAPMATAAERPTAVGAWAS
jgi:two-component system response regulator MprA